MENILGIVGFGVVGKSALKFLRNKDKQLKINIWDKRILNSYELQLIKKYKAKLCFNISLDKFINYNNIFISPGFPITEIKEHNNLLCELDLFQNSFKRDVIAITGSLGKTTITSFLAKISGMIPNKDNIYLKSVAAGNIGNAMLNIIGNKELNIAYLELSSFQLKLSKIFAPKISIFNNFYPNHLNWHDSLNDYFLSKCKIFEYQNKNQYSLFPVNFLAGSLPEKIKKEFINKVEGAESKLCFVAKNLTVALNILKKIKKDKIIFLAENKEFILYKIIDNKISEKKTIFDLRYLPNISFEINWLFILAALYLLKFDLKKLENLLDQDLDIFIDQLDQQEHRLEYFTTINNVAFYNDSKSTLFQATIKAIKKISKQNRPIILILGGLSKGVNRTPLIQYLKKEKNIKQIFCFGPQCYEFPNYKSYSSLNDVIDATFAIINPLDIVLFSPSGASFDLFQNYKHRGKEFKNAVLSRK